jgi:glycosidase
VPASDRWKALLALAAVAAGIGIGVAAAGSAGGSGQRELEALARVPARAPVASQRIYFVMTDRYANGDMMNDRGGRSGFRGVTGFDPTDPGWFHGGDLAGLTGDCGDGSGLGRIRRLGFTAIWMTPPFGQQAVQGSSAAYHGYWITDFMHVDPHLGTDADFAALVGCAHRLGLKVYLDVVVNHTADVILTGSTFIDPAERPYRDCHGNAFDPAHYVSSASFPCLSVANMPRPPIVFEKDAHAKSPDWLNDPTLYHDRGDIDFSACEDVCFEQGDFFGLDDLFTENPKVMAGLADVYASWISRFHVDGFRVDTARHVNAGFFGLWVPRILRAAQVAAVSDFQVFGEVFIPDTVELSTFVRDRGLPNVLDFPLQSTLAGFASGAFSARGVGSVLEDDDYFQRADGVAYTPPTFLGNHDMGRAAEQIASRSGAGGDALVRRVLLGTDALYVLRGAPVVMYGDEVGMIGSGGDKAAREDLFPTRVAEWQTEARAGSPPIGQGSSFDVLDNPIGRRIEQLSRLRETTPALATGASIVRYAHGSLLAVSRVDEQARREYLALFNSGTTPAQLSVTTSTPAARWTALLGSASAASSDAGGRLQVTVAPLSTLLLRAGRALPLRPAVRARLSIRLDDLSGLWQVSTTLPTGDPASVTFAVRRAGSPWQALATDDSPPYRAFLDPARYAPREQVELAAVVRGTDGSSATSSPTTFRVTRP